jgi:outer membrane murein-binding lipoprotein Lpp
MESWTPQDWVLIIGAVVGGLVTIIGALVAGIKVYIDYLAKENDDKIKAQEAQIVLLASKVKQLEHDRKRDRRRIVQLVQVLRDNNIPVPLEVPDPDDDDEDNQ